MRSWESLTIAEQTLMRRAVSGCFLAGTVQNYGLALRWAGAQDAPPPRSYTEGEQRALVLRLAAVALDLAQHGLLTVRESETHRATVPVLVAGAELRQVLNDPGNWLHTRRKLLLTAPGSVCDHWFEHAHPAADTSALPTWDELSIEQREVLVCAHEMSGMLTGAFGIWEDPPPGLDTAQRLAWVGQQITPLVPFVRDGWIEVHHRRVEYGGAFTVIGLDDLGTALADPAVRYEGHDWGVGVGCIFTYTGQAVWRGAWSRTWAQRLTLD